MPAHMGEIVSIPPSIPNNGGKDKNHRANTSSKQEGRSLGSARPKEPKPQEKTEGQ